MCKRTTRGRKPYCVDHIEKMPYVQLVMERVARTEFPVSEIVDKLPLTKRQIAFEVDLPYDVVAALCRRYVAEGLLKIRRRLVYRA